LKQIHEDLRELGYEGSYDRVAAFARQWKAGQTEWVNSASKRTKQPIFVAGAKQLYWFDLTYRQSGARLIRVTSDYVEEIAYWCNECLGGDWTLALVKLLGKSLDFDNNGKLYSNFAGGKWLLFAMDDADLALFKLRWMLA
jgi:hypothetical protein